MFKVRNYILLTIYKYSSRFDSLEYSRKVVRLQSYSRLALGIKSSISWKISVCYSQESVLLCKYCSAGNHFLSFHRDRGYRFFSYPL